MTAPAQLAALLLAAWWADVRARRRERGHLRPWMTETHTNKGA